MTVTLPDVSEFQSPASGNAPNWAGIKSQNGGAAIIRVGYGNSHLDGMLVSNRARIKSLKLGSVVCINTCERVRMYARRPML